MKVFSAVCLWLLAAPVFAADATIWKLDFGPGPVVPGWVQVLPTTAYADATGYGFEPGAGVTGVDRGGDPLHGDFITSDQPFFFSVKLPEGNYRVTVTFGDAAGASVATVKAESRRLMLERVTTAPGEFATRVIFRQRPRLASCRRHRRTPRAAIACSWTNGRRPTVRTAWCWTGTIS